MGLFSSLKNIVSAPARVIGDVTGINEIRDNPMTSTLAALLAGGAYYGLPNFGNPSAEVFATQAGDDALAGELGRAGLNGQLNMNPLTSGVSAADIFSTQAADDALAGELGRSGLSGGLDMTPLIGTGAANSVLKTVGQVATAKTLGDVLRGNAGLSDIPLSDAMRILGTIGGTAASIYGSGQVADRYADLAGDLANREDARFNALVSRDDARFNELKSREDAAIARQQGAIDFGREVGAPSRERYEASFSPGFDVGSLPGMQSAIDTSTNSLLRQLSVAGGNPYGNPGGLAEAQEFIVGNVALPELNRYRGLNAQTGGYSAYGASGGSVPGIGTSLSPTNAGAGVGTQGGLQPALGGISAYGSIFGDIGRGVSNIFNPPMNLEQALKAMKSAGVV